MQGGKVMRYTVIVALMLAVGAADLAAQEFNAPLVLVKKADSCRVVTAGGGFTVHEVIHPKNDSVNPGFSIAKVLLGPGKSTVPHRLKTSAQVYYILKGKGILHVEDTSFVIEPGDAIYIAPGLFQWAENTGKTDLEFICVVSPPWRAYDEEVIEPKK